VHGSLARLPFRFSALLLVVPDRSGSSAFSDLIQGCDVGTQVARQGPCSRPAGLPMGLLLGLVDDDRLSVLTLHCKGAWTKSFQSARASPDTRTSPPGVHLPAGARHHLAMGAASGSTRFPTANQNLIHLPPVPRGHRGLPQPVSLAGCSTFCGADQWKATNHSLDPSAI